MSAASLTVEIPASLLERFVRAVERLEATAGIAAENAITAAATAGLLTKQQVAARLGGKTSVRKIERLMKAGKLRKVPGLGARTVRFRPADVERLLADQQTPIGRRRL